MLGKLMKILIFVIDGETGLASKPSVAYKRRRRSFSSKKYKEFKTERPSSFSAPMLAVEGRILNFFCNWRGKQG